VAGFVSFRLYGSTLGGEWLPLFKKASGCSSEDKAADVGYVRNSAGLDRSHRADIEELDEKPKANQKSGWDKGDTDKYEDDQKRPNLIARICH
jgi:hypothetical protein